MTVASATGGDWACDVSEGVSIVLLAAVGTRDGTSEGVLEKMLEGTVDRTLDGLVVDRGACGISEGTSLVLVAAVGTRDGTSEVVLKKWSEGSVDGTLDGLVVDRGACGISDGASLVVVAAIGTKDGTSDGILEETSAGIVDRTLGGFGVVVVVVVVGFGALTSRSSALRDDDLVFLDNAVPFEDFLVTLLLVVFLDTFFAIRWCWLMLLSILMIEEKAGADFTVTIARKTIVKRKADKMERFMMLKWKEKGELISFVELVVAIEAMILRCGLR
jgi:hypothetical protein